MNHCSVSNQPGVYPLHRERSPVSCVPHVLVEYGDAVLRSWGECFISIVDNAVYSGLCRERWTHTTFVYVCHHMNWLRRGCG